MRTIISLFLLLSVASVSHAAVIDGVPSWQTNGGAGAGALQILGWYDLHGYDNLFAAEGENIYTQGALLAELQDFDSFLNINQWGGVDGRDIPPAVEDFAAFKGYNFAAEYITFFFFSFEDFMAEIDAGRPVSITTDNTETGFIPIEVAGVGYDMIDGVPHYGFISSLTGLTDIIWKPWIEGSTEYAWGVTDVMTIAPQAAPVPEPSTVLLFSVGIIGLSLRWRLRQPS